MCIYLVVEVLLILWGLSMEGGGGEAPGAFKEQKWAEGGYKMSRR